MSLIIAALLCGCMGALYHEFLQYWMSRLVTRFRRKSPLIGQWILTYHGDNGEEVTENIRVFAEFAGVAYGDLEARLQDGSTASYRVRFEELFNSRYSVILKPADPSIPDIGLGILSLDHESKTAQAKVLGLSRARATSGEGAYLREVSVTRA